MTYRTILLHINDERRMHRLVEAAAFLAGRQEAHLIGLYVMPPVPTYGSSMIGAGLVKGGLGSFREEAARIEAAFVKATHGLPFVAEWRAVAAHAQGVAETVMEHGRATDLIIASQRDTAWDYSSLLDEPERLAIESGRPVLIIPNAGKFATFGDRITLAWNGRREAARAAFDALPLLQAASIVRILWVNPHNEVQDAGDIPTAEIAIALARHGVKCETTTVVANDVKVGDIILSTMADDASDLLVMGAYGRSRLREFVFGGATRHILRNLTIPVLMSH